MNAKMTAEQSRRKARSLETMLSRSRVYAAQLELLAEAAIAAMEKTNNAEINEAVRIIRAAVGEARAARVGPAVAVAESACCPACQEITCDDGCKNAEARAAGGN